MRLLRDNTFRVVLVFVVVFFFLPFLFSDKSPVYEDTSALAAAGQTVEMSSNPLAKFYNRVGSFYGFKKRKSSTGLDKLNSMVKEDSVKNAKDAKDDKKADKPASPKAVDADGGVVTASSRPYGNGDEYVQVGDKTYDVVTDLAGSKYALTEYGPIELDKIISQYIPEADRELLKQYAAGDRSSQAIGAYNRYSNKGYLNNDGNFVFKSPSSNGRRGNPSMFGGENGAGSAFSGGRSGIISRGGVAGGNEKGASNSGDKLAKGFDKAVSSKVSAAKKSSSGSGARARNNFTPQVEAPKTKQEAETQQKLPVSGPIVAKFSKQKIEDKVSKGFTEADSLDRKDDADKEVVTTANTEAGKKMTEELLMGDVCKAGPCKNGDAWPVPAKVEGEPFRSFNKSLPGVLSEEVQLAGEKSDENFRKLRENIAANDKLPVTNIIMVDGYEGEKLRFVSSDKFPAQVVQQLWGNKGRYVGDEKQAGELLKHNDNVAVYVPNADSAKLLNSNGFYSAEYNSYATTPWVLDKVYEGTDNMVSRLEGAETQAVEQDANGMIAELTAPDMEKELRGFLK